MLKWPDKDPDEVLDYELDWSARLDDDTIVTSVWIVPSGIVRDSDSRTTTTTTVWLSGGSDGEVLVLTNRIVTAAARTMDQSVRLKIKAK